MHKLDKLEKDNNHTSIKENQAELGNEAKNRAKYFKRMTWTMHQIKILRSRQIVKKSNEINLDRQLFQKKKCQQSNNLLNRQQQKDAKQAD